ncbi:hypothetical protein GRAN_3809 [Granulicella sibirica]|uniref:Uncharacterized protein n=2 Tax=Granulicella sibirica TaxID=2479048 RepID=A0A4Q0SUJ8_9BACT|nr:hypothetical protein GRAN_3809 [Granulicella sibirica]
MGAALEAIAAHGAGVVLMPYDEVTTLTEGLLRADDVETEGRSLAWAAGVLSELGVSAFSLLADSRRHAAALLEAGFDVIHSDSLCPESHLPHEELSQCIGAEDAR